MIRILSYFATHNIMIMYVGTSLNKPIFNGYEVECNEIKIYE